MSKCRKCGGTGYLPHFARVDAGRCWACQDQPEQTPEQTADDDAYRSENGLGLTLADRAALRRARRQAKG